MNDPIKLAARIEKIRQMLVHEEFHHEAVLHSIGVVLDTVGAGHGLLPQLHAAMKGDWITQKAAASTVVALYDQGVLQ